MPAGEAFARRIGAGLGQVIIENRLDLRAADRDLLRSWVEAGPARAPGFHASAKVKTWQVSTERARAYLSGHA